MVIAYSVIDFLTYIIFYLFTSALLSRLRRSIRCACRQFRIYLARGARARGLQRRSLSPHNHPEGITMPRAKFGAEPLETMAVHILNTEERNADIFGFIYKTCLLETIGPS